MITSITIKSGEHASKKITGAVSLSSDDTLRLSRTDTGVKIDLTDISRLAIPMPDACPYVSKISGVAPDPYGNINLLSDVTSQVDHADNSVQLCDMSQEDRTPQLYRAVYDMLRILRRWIDAHKDSLLLTPDSADIQWRGMQEEDIGTDYLLKEIGYTKPPYRLPISDDIILDNRGRSDIPSIGQALRLYNEYQSVVAMWNYIVQQPDTIIEARIHPGDNSGIYVGVTVNIPITTVIEEDITVEVKVVASFSPQEGTYVWLRAPAGYSRIYPSTGVLSTATSVPGDTVIGTSPDSISQSVLDKEGKVIAYGGGPMAPATFTAVIDHTAARLASVYTVQMIMEAIPYNRCSNEMSYADSRRALHYTVQEKNEWNINVMVAVNGNVTVQKTMHKSTPFARVCEDPYPDIQPPDLEDEQEGV